MTTSQITYSSSENENAGAISENTLAYFQERFRNRLYDLIVGEFQKQQRESGLTQAQLAERIGKDTSRVNKWLRTPGNWTLDTISDLLLGVCASELGVFVAPLSKPLPKETGAVWFNLGSFPVNETILPSPAIQQGFYGYSGGAKLHAVLVGNSSNLFPGIRSPLIEYYSGHNAELCHTTEDEE